MSALSNDEKMAAAERYAAATRGDDAEARRAVFAPGAVIWHNFDEAEVDVDKSEKTIAWLHSTVPDLAWEDIAVLPTPTGFVSQSIMTGTAPGGPLRLHSCVIVTLDDDGLVTRIDEYLDSAQTKVMSG